MRGEESQVLFKNAESEVWWDTRVWEIQKMDGCYNKAHAW